MRARERWDTPDKIQAAMLRMAAQMPGWKPPAAHGVVLVYSDMVGSADVRFPVVNVGAHNLPALVMGVLTGRVAESATCEISTGQLADAVEMLAPAEAARMYRHPNLAAWRVMLAELQERPGGRVFVVFIDSFDTPATSPYDEALRAQIAQGQRADMYA